LNDFREEEKKMKKYLPIGTVVNLTGDEELLMICGRAQLLDSSIIWDYVACPYPEGYIGDEYNCFFNHGAIEKIHHVGYQTRKDEEYQAIIVKSIQQLTGKSAQNLWEGQDILVRGSWEGSVYQNKFLGIHFDMPEGWYVATEDEKAESWNMVLYNTDMMPDVLPDMLVVNLATIANIQITFERLKFPFVNLSATQYLEKFASGITKVSGSVSNIFADTTKIGNHDWHSISYYFNDNGAYGRLFVNIRDGLASSITITHFEGSEPVDEILAMFEPLPE